MMLASGPMGRRCTLLLLATLVLPACPERPRTGDVHVEPTPVPKDAKAPDPKAKVELRETAPAPEPQVEVGVVKVPEGKWDSDFKRTNVSQPSYPTPSITLEQCDDLTEGGPVSSDGCITAEVTCESRTIGHTIGGVQRYDSKFYEKKQCWPATRDHDSGNERIYKLVMPEGEWRAWATLYTPCADLDIAAVRHDHGGCPTMGSNVGPCEMTVNDYNRPERIELTSQTKRAGERPVWYIIVEGKNADEGVFELDIQCRPGVGGTVDP
ncbi:MAG: hypothetical protein R3F61_32570 [Myxococcota bacterium]